VVAGDAGALPEVLGDAAVLVAPTDVGALAGAIQTLADEADADRATRVARGREQVGRYDWPTTADRMMQLYRSVT
jgi:glycosyltransferase involved in cell wall biosynthesis